MWAGAKAAMEGYIGNAARGIDAFVKDGGFSKLAANSTFRGALGGTTIGGVYGAVSSDTSVLGGMAMGGLAGAGVGRYGGAALAAKQPMWNNLAGVLASNKPAMADISKAASFVPGILANAGRGAQAQAVSDAQRLYKWGVGAGSNFLETNGALNKIRSSLKKG
jgi:hypothetical protein